LRRSKSAQLSLHFKAKPLARITELELLRKRPSYTALELKSGFDFPPFMLSRRDLLLLGAASLVPARLSRAANLGSFRQRNNLPNLNRRRAATSALSSSATAP
jgi:hypothetical protein